MPAAEIAFRRLNGCLLWADLPIGKRQPETVLVDRAILRPNELVLEFSQDGFTCHVALKKTAERTFAGTWERQGQGREPRRGHIECTLVWRDPSATVPDPSELTLRGKWFEDIDWFLVRVPQ
jgi:hypothetical protein